MNNVANKTDIHNFEYDQSIIDNIADNVKAVLETEGSGHDWQHIYRVWVTAKKIAAEENANLMVVELAALLHDLDDWKLSGTKQSDHDNENDLPKARALLEQQECSQDLIFAVSESISKTGFKDSLDGHQTLSLAAKVLHDADKLDAIGAIGIARCFTFNGHAGRPIFLPDEFPEENLTKAQYQDHSRSNNTGINHFFDKLLRLKNRMYTQTGKAEAEKRHETMVVFLKEFFTEYDMQDWLEFLQNHEAVP